MIQGIVTAVLLIAFIGGTIALFGSRSSRELDAAARIPLEDEDVRAWENRP